MVRRVVVAATAGSRGNECCRVPGPCADGVERERVNRRAWTVEVVLDVGGVAGVDNGWGSLGSH